MSQEPKIWRIRDILAWTTDFFREKGIDSARLDAEVLLANVLQKDRVSLYVNYDQPLTKEELDTFREMIKSRAKRIPVSQIIGQREFMSLPFFVSNQVLTPRPETEILVEIAVGLLQNTEQDNYLAVDLGTGSGAIAVTIAKMISDASIYAVDISENALKVARKNAVDLGVDGQISFLQGNLFEPLADNKDVVGSIDLVISNPPYIPTADIADLPLEVKLHEPRQALDGGNDGLDFYRAIVAQASAFLKSGGWLCFEVGYDQASDVIRLMQESKSFDQCASHKDYAGIERVIVGRRI